MFVALCDADGELEPDTDGRLEAELKAEPEALCNADREPELERDGRLEAELKAEPEVLRDADGEPEPDGDGRPEAELEAEPEAEAEAALEGVLSGLELFDRVDVGLAGEGVGDGLTGETDTVGERVASSESDGATDAFSEVIDVTEMLGGTVGDAEAEGEACRRRLAALNGARASTRGVSYESRAAAADAAVATEGAEETP